MIQSLATLAFQTVVDNIEFLGDVGHVDDDVLTKLLVHCQVETLREVEDLTWEGSGRDLRALTHELWHGLYKRRFPRQYAQLLSRCEEGTAEGRSAARANQHTDYRLLYEEAELREQERLEQSANRLKARYDSHEEHKRSRQIQVCSLQPSSSKRQRMSSGGGQSIAPAGVRARLLEKTRPGTVAGARKIGTVSMPPQRPCGSGRGRAPARSFSRPTTAMRMSAVGGKAASAEAGPHPSPRTTRYSDASPLSAKALVALSGGRGPERACSVPLTAMRPLAASGEQGLSRYHSMPPASMGATDPLGGTTTGSTAAPHKEEEQAALLRKSTEMMIQGETDAGIRAAVCNKRPPASKLRSKHGSLDPVKPGWSK
ncbi:hypothetical protein CYMTET_9728 [Cymbomonas tetramitiformis]|uniref:Elongin-A n=1 Tax=Cymbomonas tetramitiformis TaxID=36881 RepID=A0AAE0GQW2_9CHLO|nr:hypothetical protein CYMTET_9728 [Cymbomonas tetramitiformis]